MGSVLSAFADGIVFGERFGSSPSRVLALHGWRKTHSDLAAVCAPYDAIALDLPGFGASPMPTTAWGAAEYAQALAPVLDEFVVPPVIVAHSFGGRVAVNLAAKFPDRVGSLVLTGVPLIRTAMQKKPPLAFRLAKMANRIGLVSNTKMERERRKRGSADYRAASGIQRDIFVKVVNESYEDVIQNVRCHVELVWGDIDTEAPLAQAQQALPLFHDAMMTIVQGGTHWSLVAQPHEIHAAIERCLA